MTLLEGANVLNLHIGEPKSVSGTEADASAAEASDVDGFLDSQTNLANGKGSSNANDSQGIVKKLPKLLNNDLNLIL